MRGRFITFEGGEGSGKSTHAATLAQRLKASGVAVALTREPGGSTGAETEAILFAAARDDHVRNVIVPAINSGTWIICDRFIDSTRVYQGALGHVDQRLIRSLERVTVGPAVPDLTFILDVPAQVGLARAKSRRGREVADRFEAESMEFHEKLRQAYGALAAEEPRRCVVIDGRAPREVVSERIWALVHERLLTRGADVAETVAP